MRTCLQKLEQTRAVDRVPGLGEQGSTVYVIATAGLALMTVAETLQRWLYTSPQGPIELGEPAAEKHNRGPG
jgi:hypothetical protein